jgi:oligosaccharide repeat unit polymerase
MIAVPFVYFSLLLIYVILKNGYNLGAYLISVYVISSFFSILIDINDLRSFNTQFYNISIDGAFLYCLLLTIVIYPFCKLDFRKVNSINIVKPKLFNGVVYLFFVSFIILLLSSLNSVVNILSGDMKELRNMVSSGESIVDHTPLGIVSVFVNLVCNFSLIMLLFYFYSICFLKRSKKFNLMILTSSLSIIIIGILGVDRSKTIYWLLTYGAMNVMFWKYMNVAQKRNIKLFSVVVFASLLSYVLAMTLARFGDRDTGAEGGIISYAGQSYINFCMFYDNVKYPDYTLQRIFPLFYNLFIDNGIEHTQQLNMDVYVKTGIEVSVFATFLGDILVVSGLLITVIYCIVISFITVNTISVMKKNIYFHDLLICFLLLLIPLLGIFSHFYNHSYRSMIIIPLLLYALYMKLESTKFKNPKTNLLT